MNKFGCHERDDKHDNSTKNFLSLFHSRDPTEVHHCDGTLTDDWTLHWKIRTSTARVQRTCCHQLLWEEGQQSEVHHSQDLVQLSFPWPGFLLPIGEVLRAVVACATLTVRLFDMSQRPGRHLSQTQTEIFDDWPCLSAFFSKCPSHSSAQLSVFSLCSSLLLCASFCPQLACFFFLLLKISCSPHELTL